MSDVVPPESSLRAPEIPGYRLGALLGHGSDSQVYGATRMSNHGPVDVAIKVMRPFAGEGAAVAEARFRQETAALACLDHPGLVRLVEAGYGDRPYLVTELIEGQTLAGELAEGRLAGPRVLTIARELAAALVEVHRHGLIHRDLKPSNVMVTRPSGALKILDFGFAIREDDRESSSKEVVGTFLYSAPEQTRIVRRSVDGRADLYALGCILFECATGTPPFQADDVAELLHMHAAVKAPDVRELRPEIRPVLAEIIAMLLAKDPDDRYQSARGLLADLEAIDAIEAARTAGAPYPLGGTDSSLPMAWQVPLCGRTRELGRLDALWHEARAGHGAWVQLEGEGGSGKTRLARELIARAAQAAQSRTLVLAGKAHAAEKTPLGPLREAIDAMLHAAARSSASTRDFDDRLVRAAGASAGIIKRLSTRLASRLEDAADVPPLDPASEQERFYHKVAEFIANLAREQDGAILCIDDIQWLDQGTVEILARLAAWLPTTPLLIVTSARNDAESDPARQRLVTRIGSDRIECVVLEPLDQGAVADLAAAHLGHRRLDDEVVAWLASRTSGNPFAVGEYIRAMLEQGLLTPTADGWRVDKESARGLVLASDVLDVVVKRAAKLPADAHRVLRCAAVVGFTFELDLLVSTLEDSTISVYTGLERAVRANLIEPVERGYSFLHDRVREALLDALDPAELGALHQAAAEAIERSGDTSPDLVFRLAEHYAGGEVDKNPRRVYETALAAGTLALGNFSNEEAYQWLSRAMQRAESQPLDDRELYRLREALGASCARTGRLGPAKEHFSAALDMAVSEAERAHLHHLVSLTLSTEGHNEAAWEECQKALHHVGAALPRGRFLPILSLVVYIASTWFRLRTGFGFGKATGAQRDRREMIGRIYHTAYIIAYYLGDHVRTALLSYRRLHNGHFLGSARENAKAMGSHALTLAVIAGMRKSVANLTARSVAIAEQLGDRETLAFCRLAQGFATIYSGDSVRGQELLERALPYGVEHCIAHESGLAVGAFCNSVAQQGRSRDVVRIIEEWLPTLRRLGATYYVSSNLGALHAALTILGRAGEGLRYAAERDQIARDMPKVGFVQAFRHAHNISALYEQGDLGPALEEAIDRLVAMNYSHVLARYAFVLIAYVRLGAYRAAAPGNARRQAQQALRRACWMALYGPPLRAVLTPVHRCHMYAIKAAMAAESGRYRKARRLLDRAEVDARQSASPWGLWSIHCERARLARKQSNEETAAAHARQAVAIAMEEGWKLRAAAVRAEFGLSREDASGAAIASGDRLPRSGPGSSGQGSSRPGSSGKRRRVSGFYQAGQAHGDSSMAVTLQRYFQALLEVSLASNASFDADTQCRSAMDALVQVLGAERAFLFLRQPDGTLAMQAGRDARRQEIESLTGYSRTVIKLVDDSGEPVIVTGTEEGQALGSESAVAYNLRSIMAAPLTAAGERLGVIYVDSSLVKGLFSDEQFDVLRAISNHIAIAIKTAMAARDLVAVERRRTELMAILVHEIRNPLVGILGYAEMGEEASGEQGQSGTAETFREIRTGAQRLRRIVDNVLELSRQEHGNIEWPMAPFDMAALIHEVATSNRPIAEQKDITIVTEVGALPGRALGNTDRIMQVLVNLVSNAIKFTPAGGKITIASRVDSVPAPAPSARAGTASEHERPDSAPGERAEEYIRVDVRDTGPGMDEALQARLFQKFAQGEGERRALGLGLGLYISREIIERHRGTIWVASEPGKGATFSFRVPIAPAD